MRAALRDEGFSAKTTRQLMALTYGDPSLPDDVLPDNSDEIKMSPVINIDARRAEGKVSYTIQRDKDGRAAGIIANPERAS